MNNLSDSDFLKTGQVLAIPDPSTLPAPSSSSAAAPTKTPAPTVMPKLPATYKVQAGDENLYDLAARFGVPESMQDAWVTKVVQLNHLDANGMYVGNVIKLPQ
jgi:LysM repeat protein